MPAQSRRSKQAEPDDEAEPFSSAAAWERALLSALRRERRSLGWTLWEASARSGGWLSPSSLGSYERGDRRLSAQTLYMLAQLYGVSVAALCPDPVPATDEPNVLELAAMYRLLPARQRAAVRDLIAALVAG